MTTVNNDVTGTLETGTSLDRLTPEWCTLLVAILVALVLWFGGEIDPLVARAESINTCPSGTEFDGFFQLCYPPCKMGYDGVGPVCWQRCPNGFRTEGDMLCVSNVKEFVRDTYTRDSGSGQAPTCRSGEERAGLLCYPRCRDGYSGSIDWCRQKCRSGYDTHPLTCYKNLFDWYGRDSYYRGAGRLTTDYSCPAGKVPDEGGGALCYNPCRDGYDGIGPVCWQRCPTRYSDIGIACIPQVDLKQSYGRGAGDVPQACEVESFTKSIPPTASTPMTFTLVIASDPQLSWWERSMEPAGEDHEAFVERMGIETNQHQVTAINNIQTLGTWPQVSQLTHGGGTVTQPLGVIMNGDLTSFGRKYDWGLYNKFYDPTYQEEGYEALRWPIFTGLGNHDYANNVYDEKKNEEETCYDSSADDKFCAKQSIKYIKAMMACQTVSNFDAAQITSYDNDSLAYSWDIGDYHFVQLHNYPTYDGYDGLIDSEKSIHIKPSIPWLKQDLAAATAEGKKIVLNMHDYGDHMQGDDPAFLEAIQGQNVVALFGAHWHDRFGNGGVDGNGKPIPKVIPESNIPVFYDGSSEYNKFLLAEFGDEYINVGVIDSTSGVPQFVTPTLTEKLNTYPITPIVFTDKVTTPQNNAVVINVLENDASPNGTPLTISNVGDVLRGTSRVLDGKIVYTPHPGFNGKENFTYTVSDGLSEATSEVTVTVTANNSHSLTNQPPVVADNSFALEQLSSTAGFALNVLADDSDANGDTLTLLAIETPSHGVARIENNQIIYTPQAGYTGADEFTYTVSDGDFTRIANVTVQVTVNTTQQFVYLPVVQR